MLRDAATLLKCYLLDLLTLLFSGCSLKAD